MLAVLNNSFDFGLNSAGMFIFRGGKVVEGSRVVSRGQRIELKLNIVVRVSGVS